jgi:hypothetical protein
MPVPPSTDESNPSTLPDPELNPLMNPLLAAHMGRWAEVYFTTPPEKRGQAVAELLRELEKLAPPEQASAPDPEPEPAKETTVMTELPDSPSVAEQSPRICQLCGHINAAKELYCGMCGARLEMAPQASLPVEEPEAMSALRRSEPAPFESNSVEHVSTPAADAQPVPNLYRLYLAIAVAVLLLALVYMVWRGMVWGGTKSLPPTPHSVAATGAQTTPAQPESAASSPPPAAPDGNRPEGNLPAPTEPAVTQSDATLRNQGGADAPRLVTTAAKPPATVADLWTAVGKGNVLATVALADLYLRGDGVAKNCDQARVLLQAAQRKGSKTAASRLRDLRSFDCE